MSINITKKTEDFVYYICKNIVIWINYLFFDWILTKKKNCIYNTLKYNTFEKNQIKVSEEYNLVEPNHYLKNNLETHSFCKKDSNLNRLEINDWREKIRDKWINSGFIGTLKTGDSIKVLVLDQKFYNIILSSNELNILNTATYIHEKGLRGTLIFHLENNNDVIYHNFEFHVLCNDSRWYPLRNRVLSKEYTQYLFPLIGRDFHWDEFPLDTPVGFNGPIILWEDVKKIHHIYRDKT